MILRQLRLRNIRSHLDTTVPFPLGTTLFEGDIGAGKSTILYAIEFALFGPSKAFPYSFLIRHGATSASVALTFLVEGIEYEVHRGMKVKEGKVSPDKAHTYVKIGGSRMDLSPTELREWVIQRLQFREERAPNASSVVYRYAVFTPQEEMRRVLEDDPEARLQTIRRAMGLERYRVGRERGEELRRRFGREVKDREQLQQQWQVWGGRAVELGSKAERLTVERSSIADEITGTHTELQEVVAALAKAQSEERLLREVHDEVRSLEAQHAVALERMGALQARLERAERSAKVVADLQGRLEDLAAARTRLGEFDSQLAELPRAEADLAAVRSRQRELIGEREDLARRLEELRTALQGRPVLEQVAARLPQLHGLEQQLLQTLQDQGARLAAAQALGTQARRQLERLASPSDVVVGTPCPTCHQPLDPAHLAEVRGQLRQEVEDSGAASAELQQQVRTSEVHLREARGELSRAREAQTQLQVLTTSQQEWERLATALERATRAHGNSEREAASLQRKVAEFAPTLEARTALAGRLADLEEVERSAIGERRVAAEAGALHAELDDASAAAQPLARRLADLQERQRLLLAKAQQVELPALRRKETTLTGRVEALQATLRAKQDAIDSLAERLAEASLERDRLGQTLERVHYSAAVARWLGERLLPALQQIERERLGGLSEEFEGQFARCFAALSEAPELTVAIDEGFTPVVTQEGYDVPFGSLSGGERTSVALAYRLALNHLVRAESPPLRDSNLLILDEPTDGFSKEQLGRVRDLLNAIGSEQTIIVSHERELESFADFVFHVTKVDGKTQVERV